MNLALDLYLDLNLDVDLNPTTTLELRIRG
jgi:hypothetical protein